MVQEEDEGVGEEDPGRDFEREEPRCRDWDPDPALCRLRCCCWSADEACLERGGDRDRGVDPDRDWDLKWVGERKG